MSMIINDRLLQDELIAQRRETGVDRYDEVWDGMYVMNPMPNNEHQKLVMRLSNILYEMVEEAGLGEVFPGANLSDREQGWTHNYRAPDVVVFLSTGAARNFQTHWCGGADFLVEIISPDDRSHDKLPFYSSISVREALLIDRDPWRLELYSLVNDELKLSGVSTVVQPAVIASNVLPFNFELIANEPRPRIRIVHRESGKTWLA